MKTFLWASLTLATLAACGSTKVPVEVSGTWAVQMCVDGEPKGVRPLVSPVGCTDYVAAGTMNLQKSATTSAVSGTWTDAASVTYTVSGDAETGRMALLSSAKQYNVQGSFKYDVEPRFQYLGRYTLPLADGTFSNGLIGMKRVSQ
ncbi:hypothetical protein E7T06_06150 [Deinococcus sp. Arct2-2]|uniref:hypothetical protein n=1 Tax=Deinococcus sp. Arct2-2 TaxID=2568653 RepID=UPI0010A3C240|nr:hypothetical protein [Deinococcus sp. Arct2-2]THF70717.1 hypothetical protein E7T06_06150 [Deinococcus sp. Arct2-2]